MFLFSNVWLLKQQTEYSTDDVLINGNDIHVLNMILVRKLMDIDEHGSLSNITFTHKFK